MQNFSESTPSLTTESGFRLRNWIIGGFAVPIVLSVASSVVIWGNIETVRSTEANVEQEAKVTDLMGDLGFDIQTISRATRGYLLKKSQISLNSYTDAVDGANVTLQELKDLLVDEQQKQTLAEIETTINKLKVTDQSLIDLVNQGKVEEAIAQWDVQDGRAQTEKFAELFKAFKEREKDLLKEDADKAKAATQQLVWLTLGSTVLTVLISGLIAIWIVQTTTRRLNSTASTLAASTSQIAATVEEQERTITQQAASVSETTTTMDELGASSRQSAQQAEAASDAAQQALNLADSGTQAVDQALDGMNMLKTKVGAIAAQILHLSEQTGQIGNISQLVSDLANQTNMLALNAAVEAVRAGEHGKGFSVVAAEIRKLADQSKQSAQKINDLVTDIQTAINSTVMVTDEGTKTVESSVVITQSTATTFNDMANTLNNVVLNNQQISLNIKQQATAIAQVVEAMNTINQGARETTNGIRQTKQGTQQLRDMAVFLKTIV
ncbi:MAG: methyl-accepting chemotaxis protein [Spirulina sp. SIO3F2]|nr:methyl-accepting chemotaxis protein [Spirulina sp. SIO3F2]